MLYTNIAMNSNRTVYASLISHIWAYIREAALNGIELNIRFFL